MNDKTIRPKISGRIDNMDKYDTIYLGFPIWWDNTTNGNLVITA